MKRFMKGIQIGLAVLLVGCAFSASAAERVTFTKDILPIFQDHCQKCHRPSGTNVSGMVAPMSLMTYEQTRPWAKSILRGVQSKSMPPWYASPQHHGVFENERTLTQDQIDTIVKWVKTGLARGNPKDSPPSVEWPDSGWTIGNGNPDLVVEFNEPFWVGDDVDDLYQNIQVQLTKEQMPDAKWLKAIEFKPGSAVVHHIIAYQVGRGGGGGMSAGMLGGEAPGTNPTTWPDGYGARVPKEALITFGMHYHKERGSGTGVWDSSSCAMEFHDKPVTHAVQITPIAHGAFEIPPGNRSWRVGGAHTFRRDTTLMGYMPHLHLRGVACKYTAYYPDGTSEVLLDVPQYNFNWQIFYQYKNETLIEVPAGTRVEFEMWYDNSSERAAAIGFNSNRPVAFGGPTWDEMDLGWLNYANTEPVDFDSTD